MTERRPVRKLAWKRRLFRLGLLGLGIFVGLMIAEVSLRLLHVNYPLPYVPDPYCGSRLRPGMEAEFSAEGIAWVKINQEGFRDREHPRAKPTNTYRIAVLGDSYCEAFQVSQDEAFWNLLEQQLQECERIGVREVEVLNFGVSGFGTAQELEMLRHYVWQYEPDLVLLALFAGNDISDNSKALSPNGVRPYYRLESKELVLDQSFREHPYYLDAQSRFSRLKVAWINRLRVLQLAREWYAQARQPRPRAQSAQEVNLDPTFAPPETDDWREAWEITERLVLRVRDEVQEHNAEFWLVTLSQGLQVDPDLSVRQTAKDQLGTADLFYADRRLESFAEREGLSAIILAPQFQAYADQHQVHLHGFANTRLGTGHWNQEGHRLAGTIIARELCQRIDNLE